MPRNVALTVAYNGTPFHGFQFQNDTLPTVQASLEAALSKVADHSITVTCAGRTDTGVHATHQVVNFETDAERPVSAWVRGTNRYLPDEVAVNWAGEVNSEFDARFSAEARRYLYLIDNADIRSSFLVSSITHEHRPLDEQSMHEAAQALAGEHDFSSFRAAECQAKTPVRRIERLAVYRAGTVVAIDVTATAFLHHMVRNIAGVLMEIGTGKKGADWAGQVLAARDRRAGGVTALPDGLYLVDVRYPDKFGIPGGPDLPHLYAYLVEFAPF